MGQCTAFETSAELRDLEPTPDGWRQFEVAAAFFSCSCGARVTGRPAEVEVLAAPHIRRAVADA